MRKQRRSQGSKCRRETQRNGVSQRNSQIAHTQTKQQPANPPHRAPEPCIEECAVVSIVNNVKCSRHKQPCKQDRRDDPTEAALHKPIDLPAPAKNATKRDVATSC